MYIYSVVYFIIPDERAEFLIRAAAISVLAQTRKVIYMYMYIYIHTDRQLICSVAKKLALDSLGILQRS